MAVRFDVATDKFFRTANLPAVAGPWTISFFCMKVANTSFGTVLSVFSGNSGYGNPSVYLSHSTGGGTALAIWNNGGSAAVGPTFPINTWWHFLIQRGVAANRTDVYVNRSLTPDIQSTSALTGTPTRGLEFGSGGTNNLDFGNNRIAALKWWNDLLTVDEWLIESFYYMPIRINGLQGFYPALGNSVAEVAVDYSGNERTMTTGGTLTFEDGPPIAWAPQRQRGMGIQSAGEPPPEEASPPLYLLTGVGF